MKKYLILSLFILIFSASFGQLKAIRWVKTVYVHDTVYITKTVYRDTCIDIRQVPVYERYLYCDKTNLITPDSLLKVVLKGKFTGVYFYDVQSTSTSKMQDFNKKLSENKIYTRAAVKGSTYGDVVNVNLGTGDTAKKFTEINYESEWWQQASCTDTKFSSWLNVMQNINNNSLGLTSSFYMGHFTCTYEPDSTAARACIDRTDKILLHDYRVSPEYGYTALRLSAFAKAFKGLNKKGDIYIIFSAEDSFMGPYLSQRSMDEAEAEYIKNFVNQASIEIKNWINIKGFVWFTRSLVQNKIK